VGPPRPASAMVSRSDPRLTGLVTAPSRATPGASTGVGQSQTGVQRSRRPWGRGITRSRGSLHNPTLVVPGRLRVKRGKGRRRTKTRWIAERSTTLHRRPFESGATSPGVCDGFEARSPPDGPGDSPPKGNAWSINGRRAKSDGGTTLEAPMGRRITRSRGSLHDPTLVVPGRLRVKRGKGRRRTKTRWIAERSTTLHRRPFESGAITLRGCDCRVTMVSTLAGRA